MANQHEDRFARYHTGLLIIDTRITPCQEGWSL